MLVAEDSQRIIYSVLSIRLVGFLSPLVVSKIPYKDFRVVTGLHTIPWHSQVLVRLAYKAVYNVT